MANRTAEQMFGKIARQIEADDRMLREEAARREREFEEQEARLDNPISRREVIEAIDFVVSEYSGNGVQTHDMIADAFRKLAKALS